MSFEPRDDLRHILVEAEYLVGRSAGLPAEAFTADETLRRAFVRSLEINGASREAVRALVGSSGRALDQPFGGPLWPACTASCSSAGTRRSVKRRLWPAA